MGAGNCLFCAGKWITCTGTGIHWPKTKENGNRITIRGRHALGL